MDLVGRKVQLAKGGIYGDIAREEMEDDVDSMSLRLPIHVHLLIQGRGKSLKVLETKYTNSNWGEERIKVDLALR